MKTQANPHSAESSAASNFAKAYIYLENGVFFAAKAFGAGGTFDGELIFNTSLTGYQEIISDPSYAGQFVIFSMPEIGIVGTNAADDESEQVFASGVIVRHYSTAFSNFRAQKSLDDYLKERGKIGVAGVDTRALVRLVRDSGNLRAIISTEIADKNELRARLEKCARIDEVNFVAKVSTKKPYKHTQGAWDKASFAYKNGEISAPKSKIAEKIKANLTNLGKNSKNSAPSVENSAKNSQNPQISTQNSAINSVQSPQNSRKKVAVLDYGVKRNILNELVEVGLEVEVFPHDTKAAALISLFERGEINGVFLSNGPGEPKILKNEIEQIKKLIAAKVPMLGICLGHQLLSNAFGYETYKMKFGQHGANHPVLNQQSKAVEITAQNHNYNVPESICEVATITHRNLFGDNVEGVVYKDFPIISVQHHPESSSGPHESKYIFREFAEML